MWSAMVALMSAASRQREAIRRAAAWSATRDMQRALCERWHGPDRPFEDRPPRCLMPAHRRVAAERLLPAPLDPPYPALLSPEPSLSP